jgi:hypothetical protein
VPEVSNDEHGRLADAVDELERQFRRWESMREFRDQAEAASDLTVASPTVADSTEDESEPEPETKVARSFGELDYDGLRNHVEANPPKEEGHPIRLEDWKTLARSFAAAPAPDDTRVTPTQNDASAPGERAEPALSALQQDLLVAALRLKAFDSDSRRTADELVEAAIGRDAEPNNAKKALADLAKTKGLMKSRTGRQGGYWLTVKGKVRAEALRDRYS